MKIIEPQVELWQQPDDPIPHVARCARVCYGNKVVSDNSKLYNSLAKSKHNSMFRHQSVYAIIPADDMNNVMAVDPYNNNPYIDIVYPSPIIANRIDNNIYIATNQNFMIDHRQYQIWNTITDYKVTPEKFNATEIGHSMMRYTFHITTQISTSRELNRVSPNNIAERSTRYISSCSKDPISDFDFSRETDITEAYKQGYSIHSIATLAPISHYKVRKLLVDNGFTIGTGKSITNNNCFKKIDSAEKAYLLGLLETDGSIRTSHQEISIDQHKDYYLYVKSIFEKVIGQVHVTNDRQCKRIYAFSSNIVDDLINLGIVENKTYKQTNEDIEKLLSAIPQEYYPSFIRGLFDGDGTVGFYTDKNGYPINNFGIMLHTEKLRDFVINQMFKVIGKKPSAYNREGGTYMVSIGGKQDIINWGKWLYQGFAYPFGHPKKTAIYLNFLKNNGEVIDFPTADFGDNKFTICEPYWYKEASAEAKFIYLFSLYNSEIAYSSLINGGMLRQNARGILPLDTATEVVYTYSVNEWKHIIELRSAKNAHPNAQVIANMIKDKLKELGYDIQ